MIALDIYNTFDPNGDGKENGFIRPVPAQGDQFEGGHVVMVVRWNADVSNGAFRMQNSYGEGCDDDGFFWMEYTWLGSDSWGFQQDAWVLLDSEDT